MRGMSVIAAAAAALLLLPGCGSDSDTTTVIERTVIEEPPDNSGAEADSSGSAKSGSANRGASSAGGGDITVPDVVGENHQYAQDTMQDAGLFNLREEDATGQGRLLVWDRNWIVVDQDPPARTRVSEDVTVILRSKKEGE